MCPKTSANAEMACSWPHAASKGTCAQAASDHETSAKTFAEVLKTRGGATQVSSCHAYAEVFREWRPEARGREPPETVHAHNEVAIHDIALVLCLFYRVQ